MADEEIVVKGKIEISIDGSSVSNTHVLLDGNPIPCVYSVNVLHVAGEFPRLYLEIGEFNLETMFDETTLLLTKVSDEDLIRILNIRGYHVEQLHLEKEIGEADLVRLEAQGTELPGNTGQRNPVGTGYHRDNGSLKPG